MSSISIARKRPLPSSLMVADTTTWGGKSMIAVELNFSRAKKLWSYDFGIIKYIRNWIASFRPSGLRWMSAIRTIPHLNPLPLAKGEETKLGIRWESKVA